MKNNQNLSHIVLIGALALGSCNGVSGSDKVLEVQTVSEYQTISGIPLGVGQSYDRADGTLATVITIGDKKVLAYTTSGFFDDPTANKTKYSQGEALIQSEMLDRDIEPIELTGKYDGNKFLIKKLKANGYEIDF